MRCIDGIFRAISGPAPGVIWDCENCCLGSIKPFITGIREDIPVQKHTNATEQRCIQQRLWSTRLITVNVIQFDSPENAKPQFVKTNKNVFTVMHLRDASKCHRRHRLSFYKTQSIPERWNVWFLKNVNIFKYHQHQITIIMSTQVSWTLLVCHWPNRMSQPKLPKSCWFNNIDIFNNVMPIVEYTFFIINISWLNSCQIIAVNYRLYDYFCSPLYCFICRCLIQDSYYITLYSSSFDKLKDIICIHNKLKR